MEILISEVDEVSPDSPVTPDHHISLLLILDREFKISSPSSCSFTAFKLDVPWGIYVNIFTDLFIFVTAIVTSLGRTPH